MTYYVGILDGKKNVWGVRIPDVPGCHGGGATPDEAIADAIQALRDFASDGPLPAPRRMDTVRDDADSGFDATKECLVMLPLIAEQHQTVKANISMDAGRLAAIDAAAELQGMTRSGFFEAVALEAISGESGTEFPQGSFARSTFIVGKHLKLTNLERYIVDLAKVSENSDEIEFQEVKILIPTTTQSKARSRRLRKSQAQSGARSKS